MLPHSRLFLSVPYNIGGTGMPICLLLASSAFDQFRRSLSDTTFAGIHQASWFDWAMLIPYFGILFVLSIYGLHRYEVIHSYFKNRKMAVDQPPLRFAELPRVTIQLPLYNERYVVERLIDETNKVEYPKHLLQIQVLDDSTDETHLFAEALVQKYQALGFPVEYQHRTNRHGYKAGALQEGLKTATGEFVAVFDADFVPPPEFLMRTVHHFANPKIGVVQTRWSYLNKDYNFLTEVEAMLLDGHFVLEHGARSRAGLFFNFNGTAGILRKSMIADAGGWQHDTLTEDSDLSYRAQMKGWKFVYLPGLHCPSELPVEMHGFQVQQFRWAKGLTQVAKKLLPSLMRAKLPFRVKLEAFLHLTAEHFVSADGGGVRADAARDDLPILHGLGADGVSGYPADFGFVCIDFRVLHSGAERVASEELEAFDPNDADADGGRGGADDY